METRARHARAKGAHVERKEALTAVFPTAGSESSACPTRRPKLSRTIYSSRVTDVKSPEATRTETND
jgi:hypothetical protein